MHYLPVVSPVQKRLGAIAGSVVLLLAAAPAGGQGGGALDHCQGIPDGAARLRCYDQAVPKPPPGLSVEPPRSIGAWRLVRTPHPQGDKDAVSIMRSADPSRSAPEFVGIMLRCGVPEIEVLAVVIPPLPPRVRPVVTVGTGQQAHQVVGEVTPPGAAIRLPAEVTADARARWPQQKRLELSISHDGSTFGGAVDLADFTPALQALTAACTAR